MARIGRAKVRFLLWIDVLKRELKALYVAALDHRTPLAAKLIAGFVVAYMLSPIDLIPDFIPVFGLLDDLLLVPAGLWLAVKFIPDELMAECRQRGRSLVALPGNRIAAIVIVLVWITVASLLGAYLFS